MSRYPNMSYCMCENTLLAMQQIVDAMYDEDNFLENMNQTERNSFHALFQICQDFIYKAESLVEHEDLGEESA